ncbi:hypothetical protein D3C72_1303040 [compost metagenome]
MSIQSPNNSQSGKRENPAPFYVVAVPQRKKEDKVKYDDKKTGQGISAEEVSTNGMLFNIEVGNYNFVEKDGQIYRIGENGIEYPPITKEKFEKIAKERKSMISKKASKLNNKSDDERA